MLTKEQIEEQIRKGDTGFRPLRPGYGEYLTGKRIERGLTMRKLAETAGIPAIKISNIELEKKGYSLHDLRCCLKVLDIPMDEIMTVEGAGN
jgi:transcriptional regulator with XRE-family HTH domain